MKITLFKKTIAKVYCKANTPLISEPFWFYQYYKVMLTTGRQFPIIPSVRKFSAVGITSWSVYFFRCHLRLGRDCEYKQAGVA